MRIQQAPSPNFNDRKTGIDMLMLHYTGMKNGEAALARMRERRAEVSAHYMVWEDGRVTQLVDEADRAWHAGVGIWQGDADLNSCSVGVEIVNGGHNLPLEDGTLPPYPDEQIASVIELSQAIIKRHKIPQSRIVGHSDIAPERKEDPGEHFPWKRLSEAGVGLWPGEPQGTDGGPLLMGKGIEPGETGEHVERLQTALLEIGYGIAADGNFSEAMEHVVTAFQRRWRQHNLTGAADLDTIRRIMAVSASVKALGADHG